MSAKIIRDPLYNYIGIDRKRDGWLLAVLNSPEIQRLRRVHQLGVSYLTYPGADHSRLVHSLGVLHLMTQMMEHLESNYEDAQVRRAREPLLAAALIHDVGHGPFSHLFEPCLGMKYLFIVQLGRWSARRCKLLSRLSMKWMAVGGSSVSSVILYAPAGGQDGTRLRQRNR